MENADFGPDFSLCDSFAGELKTFQENPASFLDSVHSLLRVDKSLKSRSLRKSRLRAVSYLQTNSTFAKIPPVSY